MHELCIGSRAKGKELRGFAPIGMLEVWNNGSGKMSFWVIGNTPLDKEASK
jgi:hypothetical protein